MYKVVSARDPKALEDLLNASNVKQVYAAWVYNGTPYALIQIDIIEEVKPKVESKPETKVKPKVESKPETKVKPKAKPKTQSKPKKPKTT